SLTSRMSIIGPSSPPKNFVAVDFLSYLIDLVHESRRLGWIRNAHESTELLEVLFEAKRRIERGQPAKAAKRFERFVKNVEKEGCRDFRCSDAKRLSSEAFALLFFNGQFLLDHLPAPSKAEDDD